MLLSNFKISIRLGISFSILIVALVFVAFFSARTMKGLATQTEQLYKHPYTVSTAILRVDSNITRMHSYMKNLIIAKKAEDVDLALSMISELENKVILDIKTLEASISGDTRLVDQLHNQVITWKPIRDNFVTLVRSGEHDKAIAVTKKKQDLHLKQLFNTVASLKNVADSAATTFLNDAIVQKDRSLILTYSASIVTILVAFVIYILLSRSILIPIRSTTDAVKDLAEGDGDLTARLPVGKDEIGELAHWTNTFIEKLQGMTKQLHANITTLNASSNELLTHSESMATGCDDATNRSNNVASAAEELSANMNGIAAASEQTSVNVNMVASASEEMSNTINEIAGNTEKARIISEEAVGKTSMAAQRVNELGGAAKEISKVTEVITEISEQTNLLALNATIEAARAGEAGKGFAVVANEIKELAKQTAEATLEIRNKIEAIQSSSNLTVSEIGEINETINDVSEIVSTIASAVEEQSAVTSEVAGNVAQAATGITEVNDNVSQSSTVSAEISRDIHEVHTVTDSLRTESVNTRQRAEDLSTLAEQLEGIVRQFKI